MILDCEFIMTPRILFSDKNLTRVDIDLLSLIISLTLKKGYCYATNKYLANYINSSIRTIGYSLSKLKTIGYIKIEYETIGRRIYLNTDKIPMNFSTGIANNCKGDIASNCNRDLANDCNQNIKEYNKKSNNITKNKKELIPYWMEHEEVCECVEMTAEELKEMEDILNEITS